MNPIKRPNEWPQSRRGGGAARLASNDDTGIVASAAKACFRLWEPAVHHTGPGRDYEPCSRPDEGCVPRGTYIPACGATPEHGRR